MDSTKKCLPYKVASEKFKINKRNNSPALRTNDFTQLRCDLNSSRGISNVTNGTKKIRIGDLRYYRKKKPKSSSKLFTVLKVKFNLTQTVVQRRSVVLPYSRSICPSMQLDFWCSDQIYFIRMTWFGDKKCATNRSHGVILASSELRVLPSTWI